MNKFEGAPQQFSSTTTSNSSWENTRPLEHDQSLVITENPLQPRLFEPEYVGEDEKSPVESGQSETDSLVLQFDQYLGSFYSRLQTTGEFNVKVNLESIRGQGVHIIDINNKVADQHATERYKNIKEHHKDQRGKSAIAIIQCIDGRNSIPHGIDQIGSVWETKAGILSVEESAFGDGEKNLESSRLEESIVERAQNSEKGPLLEILVAHKGKHSCGAMNQRLAQGLVPEGTTDLVLENLRLHEESAQVIKGIYNRNVAREEDKLEKVAITAVYDNDTMSYIFGYETDAPLRTTDLAEQFENLISNEFDGMIGEALKPGAFRENFDDVDTLLDQKDYAYAINDILLSNERFVGILNDFLDKNHPELNEDQRQAFRYMTANNTSFQYLTGLYKEAENPSHPFFEHNEVYQAVSLDGITMGQYDPEHQVFGASPSSAEEAIDVITTQCALMDSIGKAEKPYMLFLSRTVPEGKVDNGTLENTRGILRKTFTKILKDPTLNQRVRSGELAIIPVLIDRSRRVVQIPNFAK